MRVSFGGRLIGAGQSPYIIAEIGSNHNGDISLARRMIDEAVRCGADAVKFQSWSDTSLISRSEYDSNTEYADKERHFGSLYDMVTAYQLTPAQHHELAAYCRDKGIHFLSSVFSRRDVDLLVEIDVPAIKIASMDVTYPLLLEYAASSGKPIILSTGLASLDETVRAVRVLREAGCTQLVVLHCISIYPPSNEDIHLNNIGMLRGALQLPIGFSDHSLGTAVALGAVALGACVIEKHFTLDRSMQGWDHWMSLDPAQLETLCRDARTIFEALGDTERRVGAAEMEKRRRFRRSIVAAHQLMAGAVIAPDDLDYKRPGTGISPAEFCYVVGRRLRRDVAADQLLGWSDLE